MNRNLGVSELQIIEPMPSGKILGSDVDFDLDDVMTIWELMGKSNENMEDIAISSFAHFESPEYFGCAAGRTHIYIDGTGELSPCNLIAVTYGNAATESLSDILTRMKSDYRQPYLLCLAYRFQDYFAEHTRGRKPVPA